jgi:hypothetical protein
MAYSQTDLDRLQRAIARGVKTVTYNGETVVYTSLDEMLRAERRIKQELGLTGAPSRRYATTDKGL